LIDERARRSAARAEKLALLASSEAAEAQILTLALKKQFRALEVALCNLSGVDLPPE